MAIIKTVLINSKVNALILQFYLNRDLLQRQLSGSIEKRCGADVKNIFLLWDI